MVAHFFLLQLFVPCPATFPQLNLLGRERICTCAPVTWPWAAEGFIHPIWSFMTSGEKEVIEADEF